MITILKIQKYVDSCVERFKANYIQQLELNNKEDFDFIKYRYSPTMFYFDPEYNLIEISKEVQQELMNMNTTYRNKCQNWLNNL